MSHTSIPGYSSSYPSNTMSYYQNNTYALDPSSPPYYPISHPQNLYPSSHPYYPSSYPQNPYPSSYAFDPSSDPSFYPQNPYTSSYPQNLDPSSYPHDPSSYAFDPSSYPQNPCPSSYPYDTSSYPQNPYPSSYAFDPSSDASSYPQNLDPSSYPYDTSSYPQNPYPSSYALDPSSDTSSYPQNLDPSSYPYDTSSYPQNPYPSSYPYDPYASSYPYVSASSDPYASSDPHASSDPSDLNNPHSCYPRFGSTPTPRYLAERLKVKKLEFGRKVVYVDLQRNRKGIFFHIKDKSSNDYILLDLSGLDQFLTNLYDSILSVTTNFPNRKEFLLERTMVDKKKNYTFAPFLEDDGSLSLRIRLVEDHHDHSISIPANFSSEYGCAGWCQFSENLLNVLMEFGMNSSHDFGNIIEKQQQLTGKLRSLLHNQIDEQVFLPGSPSHASGTRFL